jgi:hypothetical protein
MIELYGFKIIGSFFALKIATEIKDKYGRK